MIVQIPAPPRFGISYLRRVRCDLALCVISPDFDLQLYFHHGRPHNVLTLVTTRMAVVSVLVV